MLVNDPSVILFWFFFEKIERLFFADQTAGDFYNSLLRDF